VPFVLEVRDLWPESLAAVGAGSPNSLLYRGLAKVAGFLYRNADRVVVVTPAFKEYLIERWRVPREKISVVEHGVRTDLFAPHSPQADLRQELGAEGKFVVSYIGTMGMAHGLETVVEAASRLQQVAPEVLFVLVGEGAEKQRIRSLARSRNLTNLHFVDQQSRERIPAYICASDACLVLLKKSELFKTVLPTKLVEFMSCARPVILGVGGHAREIVQEANAGIFVEPENSADLANAVMRLAANPGMRESLGRNGRRYALQHFSYERIAKTYVGLLEGLSEEDRSFAVAAA